MLKQLHDYDPRYEMGQECHGLDNPLECSVAQLIQHQGEKYWYREEDDELKRTDNERIAYNGPKIEIPEECNEVFEPDPGASENPKIEFDMVVPTSDLSTLQFFLQTFSATRVVPNQILIKSATGEVFNDYAYLTIEGILQ